MSMSPFQRFRGTLLALAALLLVGGVWWWLERDRPAPEAVLPDEVFRFDKEDLVAFEIDRPDGRLAMRREPSGDWTVQGESWRPNRAMIRRVAHQLHDLTARADVVDSAQDPGRYGLGEGAIQVGLTFADGSTRRFVVGDPNPTGVSHYLQTLDGPTAGRIYVVKKSASDFWRLPVESFREDRITSFDADEVERLDATVDGRELVIVRTEHRRYQQLVPLEQPASREEVRMMLGRVSALRVLEFIADQPSDLRGFGLEPPAHRIAVHLAGGSTVTLQVGPDQPGTDPPRRLVYLVEDEAVYAVKDGFLEAFRLTDDALRDRELVGKHEWEVTTLKVTVSGEEIVLSRTSDSWRWEDGQAVAGSTPKRVAGRAAELEALVFHDEAPPALTTGLEPPWATVELALQEGGTARIELGARWEVDGPVLPPPPPPPGSTEPPPPPRPQRQGRQYARVGGLVVEVEGSLAESIEDLAREHARKRDRDAQKNLDEPDPPR
jgi:hypothetical protein